MSADVATSVGMGIVFGKLWCFEIWPSDLKGRLHNSVLEMIPLVVAAILWSAACGRLHILFETDNMAVRDIPRSGLPNDPHLAFLARELAFLAVTRGFFLQGNHIPGKSNTLADLVSRGKLD